MEIKDIVQKAHDNAVKHGFWDPPLPFGTAIALIHSELSEALEEERAGNRIRPGDPVPMIYYSGGGYVATAPTKCCVKPEGVAVELAEVSLWLNTIYPNGFVPWFGTQLVNGNSLIGARRQCYRVSSLQATSKGLRWYEKAPERVPLGTERKRGKLATQIYHFLLGDPGMCSYTDKVIKQLEPAKIKLLNTWNKAFIVPYSDDDIETLKKLSKTIDKLWKDQISLRQQLEQQTHPACLCSNSMMMNRTPILPSAPKIRCCARCTALRMPKMPVLMPA